MLLLLAAGCFSVVVVVATWLMLLVLTSSAMFLRCSAYLRTILDGPKQTYPAIFTRQALYVKYTNIFVPSNRRVLFARPRKSRLWLVGFSSAQLSSAIPRVARTVPPSSKQLFSKAARSKKQQQHLLPHCRSIDLLCILFETKFSYSSRQCKQPFKHGFL
jgi:hypothetical protein